MESLSGFKLNIVSAIAFSSEVNFLGFFKPEGDKLLRQRKRIAKSDAISKQIETINDTTNNVPFAVLRGDVPHQYGRMFGNPPIGLLPHPQTLNS